MSHQPMAQEPIQEQSGAEAKGGTEAAAVVAPADSLNNPGQEQTYAARLKTATTPAAIKQLTQDLIEGRVPPPAAATEDGGRSTEDGAPKTEAGTAEPTAEEKAAEAAAQAEAAAAETEKQRLAAEEAKKVEEADELPERIRLTQFSKVEKLALTIKRENPKLTLAQAEAKAKDALGVEDEPAAKETAATTGPQTVEQAEAKIKELTALRTKAFKEDLDFAEGDRLTNEIEALRDRKVELREQSGKQATAEQSKYDEAFTAAEARAHALYDFVKQPESAAYKRMGEIDRQLEANGDPLFNSPDKPFKISQMVAGEMAIAPKSTAAKTVVAKPVVAAKPDAGKKTVPPVVAASGASRTSTASTQGDGLTTKILACRTPADLEALTASLVGKT